MSDPEAIFKKHAGSDGVMSSTELETALQQMGVKVSPALIQSIKAQYDKEPHSGSLELTEFQKLVTDMQGIQNAGLEETLQVFTQTYDKDGSGFIQYDELKAGLEKLGIATDKATVDAIFQLTDTNNDGKISLQELAVVIGHGK